MWIRNQNKDLLINTDRICVCDYGYDEYSVLGGNYKLGVYSTKEKALKVLDEIQNVIKDTQYYKINNYMTDRNYILNKGIQIYEMPQDEEVERNGMSR